MKKSIPGKTRKEAVSEKSGSGSDDSGFRGLVEGRLGADDPLGEEIVLGWTDMDVYFQLPEGQKVNSDQIDPAQGSDPGGQVSAAGQVGGEKQTKQASETAKRAAMPPQRGRGDLSLS